MKYLRRPTHCVIICRLTDKSRITLQWESWNCVFTYPHTCMSLEDHTRYCVKINCLLDYWTKKFYEKNINLNCNWANYSFTHSFKRQRDKRINCNYKNQILYMALLLHDNRLTSVSTSRQHVLLAKWIEIEFLGERMC